MYNPFSLEGKTILVTGASSGIGRAVAVECSKMGAVVFLSARNEARLRETMDMMEGDGHQIITADLTNEADILAFTLIGIYQPQFFCNLAGFLLAFYFS